MRDVSVWHRWKRITGLGSVICLAIALALALFFSPQYPMSVFGISGNANEVMPIFLGTALLLIMIAMGIEWHADRVNRRVFTGQPRRRKTPPPTAPRPY